MFSANPFGQSSSPFGSPSVFGQTSNTPFGSPNPFGSQPGSSIFGGTSTGMFGQSTPTFSASSSLAFGSSMPSFGAASTPAFGSSSSSFGGSVFGQTPAFGGFGSTPSQSSPFGNTFQQTQSAFGSNPFGSTTFGASSQPAFGATSTPAFGSSSTPAFGATTTPAFGAASTPAFGATSTSAFTSASTPAFGSTSNPAFGSTGTPAFGSTTTPLFGSTGTAFGVSSTPAFGSAATSAFGTPGTSLFGSSSTPAFGAASTQAFGSSSTSAFGASSTPSFSFGSTPAFGQSVSTFGSTPFGTTPSPFGAQSSQFGAQTTTPTFGSPGFGQTGLGGQQLGSRVVPYSPTQETDAGGTQPAGKLESISAMHAYKDKSHEELRWEDYQRGDKGGPNPSGQPAGGLSFSASAQVNPFGSTSTFGQPSANPFSSATSSNPFAPKTPSFGSSGFGSSSPSPFGSTFGSTSSNPFSSTSSTPSLFGTTSNTAFGAGSSPSFFGGTTTAAFGSSPSLFGSTAGSSSTFSSGLNFGNTQSSGLFQSSTPTLGQSTSPFGQPAGFQQTTPPFGSNSFSTTSTGFGGGIFSSSASMFSTSNPVGFGQSTPSLTTPFQPSAPAQSSSSFSFPNFGQMQPAASSGFGGTPSFFNQGTFGQSVATQPNMVMQLAPVTNPFGTLPAMPQMSIGRAGSAPSVQYGISTMPVSEKQVPVRISTLLCPRHLSQRRIRLPARKYHPKIDGQRVPFFSDDESTSAAPKADALFIPRENPRALFIRPIEQWSSRTNAEKHSLSEDSPVNGDGQVLREPSAPVLDETAEEYRDEHPIENDHAEENSNARPSTSPSKTYEKTNGVSHGNHSEKESSDLSYFKISGHRAGEAAIVYEHGAGIEALMPKLRHADYYTEPRIQELAAKERAEPGFCRHVKDFVVGRRGFGNIRFFGETDVRRLDLESIVQFNNREVIVYKDEAKKPGVGQGLNKPAEVTLLNVNCVNKRTGEQFTEGPNVEKYKEMLKKKAEEQGAEFISYDPVKGEWKFRVKHFSSYEFGDGDTDDLFLRRYL